MGGLYDDEQLSEKWVVVSRFVPIARRGRRAALYRGTAMIPVRMPALVERLLRPIV
jgi:hypothetical protein